MFVKKLLGDLEDVPLIPSWIRPWRDATCLSVVSFNSTTRRALSFIVSYIGN